MNAYHQEGRKMIVVVTEEDATRGFWPQESVKLPF